MDRADVLRWFADRDFDRLVDQFESDWLECKREPHRLDDGDSALYELAKDVSALANSGGGLLLYGVTTNRDEAHQRDRIRAIAPFPVDRFSEPRWRQCLENWLVPRAPLLRFDLVPRAGGMVVLIEVGPAAADWPILINKVIGQNARASEMLVAFCERANDHVKRTSPLRLQSLLRDGMRFSDEFRGYLETIQVAVGRLEQPPAPRFDVADRYPACRELAIGAANLQELPVLSISCLPARPVDLTELFAARRAPLVQLLEHPPFLREAGFNIQSGINSTIVAGESRRSTSPDHNALEMYRDGAIVYAVRADDQGLCWPEGRYQPQRINPIFLVETVYLFTILCHQVLAPRGAGPCSLSLEINRMRPGGAEDPPASVRTLLGRPIQHVGEVVRARWDIQNTPVQRFAAEIVAEMFRRFGLEDERNPCVVLRQGVREVDPDAIRRLG